MIPNLPQLADGGTKGADYAAGVVVCVVFDHPTRRLFADLVARYRIVRSSRLRGRLGRAVFAEHGQLGELVARLAADGFDLDTPDWSFVADFLIDYDRLHPAPDPDPGSERPSTHGNE